MACSTTYVSPVKARMCHTECVHLQDLLTEGPILDTVLARMPQDMQETRERRIRRAFDLSLKKVRLGTFTPYSAHGCIFSRLACNERRLERGRPTLGFTLQKYLPESEWVDPFQEVETYDKLLSQAQIETDERKHMNDEYW